MPSLLGDQSGILWVATEDGGLNLITDEGESIEDIPLDKPKPVDSRRFLNVSSEQLLVGTSNGLYTFDLMSKKN